MTPLALVTGGQQGIGLGIATALAERGLAASRSPRCPAADDPSVTGGAGPAWPGARYFQHDLSQVEVVPALLDRVEGEMGPIIDPRVRTPALPPRCAATCWT